MAETAAHAPSWHDNLIYGLRIDAADPDNGLWRSDLVLDIDHILEWLRLEDGSFRFRVAPATLTFHDVTDLRISVAYEGSFAGMNLNELSISEIEQGAPLARERPQAPLLFPWCIKLNHPPRGEISFNATGYTQTLRAAPRICDEQRLPLLERSSFAP